MLFIRSKVVRIDLRGATNELSVELLDGVWVKARGVR